MALRPHFWETLSLEMNKLKKTFSEKLMVNNYCFCFVSLTSGLHVCTITGHVTSRLMVRGLCAVHLIRKGGIWLVRGRYIEVVLCGRTHWLSRLKPLLLLLLLICQFCECLKDTQEIESYACEYSARISSGRVPCTDSSFQRSLLLLMTPDRWHRRAGRSMAVREKSVCPSSLFPWRLLLCLCTDSTVTVPLPVKLKARCPGKGREKKNNGVFSLQRHISCCSTAASCGQCMSLLFNWTENLNRNVCCLLPMDTDTDKVLVCDWCHYASPPLRALWVGLGLLQCSDDQENGEMY